MTVIEVLAPYEHKGRLFKRGDMIHDPDPDLLALAQRSNCFHIFESEEPAPDSSRIPHPSALDLPEVPQP